IMTFKETIKTPIAMTVAKIIQDDQFFLSPQKMRAK
ncbi:hypothetical protein AAUPMB_00435, partial [Pasteurella multocida subsp. multocida str. Anand1_buffalo]